MMPAIGRPLGVLLASADKAQLAALRLVIEQQKSVCVVGEATDTQSVMEQILGNGAKFLLLDWELPVRRQPVSNSAEEKTSELAVRDLISLLRSLTANLRIIVLVLKSNLEKEAYAAGADFVVRKTDPPDRMVPELIKEIRYHEVS